MLKSGKGTLYEDLIRFIVTGYINSPQNHYCAKLNISMLLTVTYS
jgi:hypothetical protein